MAQISGWGNYNGGYLDQRFDNVDADNHKTARGIQVSERDINLSHIYAAPRGPVPGPHYLPERPPPIVLPSISQLSDMVPMTNYSFPNYGSGYPTVTQDGVGNATMMPSTRTTFSDFPSLSPAENQNQINSAYQINTENSHEMRESSRLPALNLNFTPGGLVLNDIGVSAPQQSVTESRISQPSHSSNVEAYHQGELHPRSNPYSLSPTSSVTPQQRPIIMRHNIHTHQCDRCPSRFTRAGELKRHYKMHLPERRMFHCWIAGCDRNGEKGFYRSDKFRDHQRKAHRCGKMLGNRGVD